MKQENNTERQILEAAEVEFMSKGFAGARTTSIAAAAGVTHAMLHYYFRTKEQLFDKVLNKKVEEVLTSVAEAFECSEGRTLTERICNAARAHFDYVLRHPTLPLFMINEIVPHPDRLKSYLHYVPDKILPLLNEYAKEVEQASDKGEICKVGPLDLFIDIASMNLVSVIVKPLIMATANIDSDAYDHNRREEITRVITKRLQV